MSNFNCNIVLEKSKRIQIYFRENKN